MNLKDRPIEMTVSQDVRHQSPKVLPLLRWAGSKRKLVPELLPYWRPSHFGRYVEPFVGSGALFYAIAPGSAILSDVNAELVEALTIVRNHPRAVYGRLMALPRGRVSYYRLRDVTPAQLSPVDRSARFLFLNRFCFNGLYRTNMNGSFNVPFSPSGTGEVPLWKNFLRSARLLRNADLRIGDFEKVVRATVRSGDFVYLDPPYAVSNRRMFRQYGPNTFGLDDLARLARLLDEIDKRGAKFVLSYALSPEWHHFFTHWKHQTVFAQRNIAGFAKHRRVEAEMLATNIDT